MNAGSEKIMSKMEARSRVAMKGWQIGVMFVLAALATSEMGRAQAPTPNATNAQSSVTRVEKLYYDGVAAAKKKQWESARALFEEAFKLDPRPQIAVNLGNAELELGKAREAAEHFAYFLREEKQASPDDRAGIQALLDKALTKIAVIEVTADTEGAEVFVDGQSRGKTPLTNPIYIDPGSYTIEVKHADREPGSQRAAVTAGAKLSLDFKLKVIEHVSKPVVPQVPTEPKWRKPLIYTGIGLSGAAALVGIGTAIGAGVKASERDENSKANGGTLADYKRLEDERVGLANAAFYAFVGAGVFGAATAIYALTGKKAPAPIPQKAGIIVVPAGPGFVVKGMW